MAGKGKKQVANKATQRSDSKTVRSEAQKGDGKPVWRFSTVDRNGPFSWPKGQQEELDIVQKLHQFDSMEWSGRDGIAGKQHHFLSEGSLSKKAKDRLKEIKKDDDIESLFSFHLQGKPRVIAIRHGDVAKLLWYDPDHQVAPSKLKHT